MLDWVGKIIGDVTGTVSKIVPDRDLAAKLNAELSKQMLDASQAMLKSEMEAQSSVIIAEAKGESAVQRNWRPHLMYLFMVIIGNNFLLAPYIKLFWHEMPLLTLPNQAWDLLTYGMSGYVVGRTVEKGLEIWKRK